MRSCCIAFLLGSIVFAPLATAEDRFVTFVFGPNSAATARQAAHAAAVAARHWIDTQGASFEIRPAGSPEPLSLPRKITPKSLEQAFTEAATQARDADPSTFLTALDAGAQSAVLHSGLRIVVAALNSPPLSIEAEGTLDSLVEFCRTNAVRVVVVDIAQTEKSESNSPLEMLGSKTGGAWLRQGKPLDSTLTMIAAAATARPATPATVAKASPEPPVAETSATGGIPYQIPVHTKFIRTSMTGSVSAGAVSNLGGGEAKNSAVTSVERPFEANDTTGPLRGMITVESPLNALKFETDDNAGTYLARARITSTIRNQKGRAVWTAQKLLNITGPLRKMSSRQQGSLLFMRGVTLPGGDRYTLEAKVEDLLGGTTGTIQTPLVPVGGAPGLMASDALFVRPFKGASDKFEADQVLSYEGQALSPVLNPVFRAEEEIVLQLYFILYPDIRGEPPQLNLELSRDGQVVTRMPIAFTSAINDPSLEGKFGTLGGKGSVMMGGRAREFPYMASIKGAKLSAGMYDALVSIKQGRSVITRKVAFRVVGSSPAPSEMVATSKAGADVEDENANVVLPSIEAVTIETAGLSLGRDEQNRLWTEATKNALGYTDNLPNFRCTQETHRFIAPVKNQEQLKEADSFRDELTYEGGRESYRTVEINGVPTESTRKDLKGVHSQGEFGSLLRGLFDPAAGATYKWVGRAMAVGVLCEVFEVEVSRPKSNFTLTFRGRREPAGYTGRVYIDEDTGLVRRLTIEGVGLPKDFGMQSPAFSLDYGMVRVGTADYLLPLRSVLQVRQLKTFVRNESVFRDYHRFDASSEITVSACTNCPAGVPENAKTLDQLFEKIAGVKSPGAALAAVRDGKVVLVKCFGLADVEKQTPITPATKFRLASVTKSFTAIAVLQLVEAGKLKLDDPLAKYVPDFPNADKILISHLLGHTAGVPDFISYEEVKKRPLEFDPGSRINYSNNGYQLLGRVVEKVSGQPWDEYVRDHIFKPLGMKDSGLDRTQELAGRATGYLAGDDGAYTAIAVQDAAGANSAGGLYSTLEDMIRWEQGLSSGKLLREETLQRASLPGKLKDGRTTAYGLGWMTSTYRGLREVGHGGDITGFNTYVARYPDEKFTVIALSNTGMRPPGPVPVAADAAHRVAEIWLADRMQKSEATPSFKVPIATLDTYVGRYKVEAPEVVLQQMGTHVVITREGDHLVAQANGPKTPLNANSETAFQAAGSPVELTFVPNATGKPSTLVLTLMGLREFQATRVD